MTGAAQDPASQSGRTPCPTIGTAVAIWGKIGLFSFGGPAAQIALMQRIIVDEKGWLTETQFLNALSFCMLLPGPEAMQLATYAGWRLNGIFGGLVAGLLFVLPGALVMMALGTIYVLFGNVGVVDAVFLGIKAGITIIVLQALQRLSAKTLQSTAHIVIALASFVGIFLVNLPFPALIALAAAYGFLRHHRPSDLPHGRNLPATSTTLHQLIIWLGLWWLPIFAIDHLAEATILADIGYFFSKLAIVTFGGAYAVLAYMAQEVVGQLGWLSPAAMLDGLGLAETTPGPLILVTQFVGFVAGFGAGGLWLGFAGALVALWATFIPCFLWIFVGAPYVDWITNQPRLRGALGAIMAAIVGVIANLFLWFALHSLFTKMTTTSFWLLQFPMPDLATLDWRVVVIGVICGWMVFLQKWSLFPVLGGAALCGIILAGAGLG
jgi:chromate transporter